MRRDIKLNIQVLTDICIKINTYINALEQIEKASATFLETIKEQDSQAYERLSGLWEENVTANESDLKERFAAIAEVLSGYIRDTGSYIAPIDPALEMRVDIDDIYFNHNQIQVRALDFWDIIRDSGSSWGIYGEIFIYDIFKDEATNEARKQAIEAENAAEKARRERNYAKLAAFRETLEEKVWGSLFESLMGMQDIYDKRIVPFENTDDDYKKKIDHYYDEWKSFGDGWADFWDGVWDVLCGAGSAIGDLLIGLVDLLKLLGEMFAWSTLNALWADELGFMPEWLDEDVTGFFDGIGAMLKDPGSALEAMGQELFDTADEKGLAYSISYVATDTLVGWAIGKGLGKLSKAEDVTGATRYIDDIAQYGDEAAEVLTDGTNAIKFSDWDDMKEAFEGTISKFIKDNKPKYSPDIKKWFDNGGTIQIETIDGKQIWTYTSPTGISVPYVDGYIRFPDEYLNPIINSVDIGEFSGDRSKDIQKMLEILEDEYGITEIPEGYVVHHDATNGILQLVEENIHKEFTHIGGYSIYK